MVEHATGKICSSAACPSGNHPQTAREEVCEKGQAGVEFLDSEDSINMHMCLGVWREQVAESKNETQLAQMLIK